MEILLILLAIVLVPVIMIAIGASQFAKAMETFREIKKK